jgi:hypothetical protein
MTNTNTTVARNYGVTDSKGRELGGLAHISAAYTTSGSALDGNYQVTYTGKWEIRVQAMRNGAGFGSAFAGKRVLAPTFEAALALAETLLDAHAVKYVRAAKK